MPECFGGVQHHTSNERAKYWVKRIFDPLRGDESESSISPMRMVVPSALVYHRDDDFIEILVCRGLNLARPGISNSPIRLNREETVEVCSQDVEVQ